MLVTDRRIPSDTLCMDPLGILRVKNTDSKSWFVLQLVKNKLYHLLCTRHLAASQLLLFQQGN